MTLVALYQQHSGQNWFLLLKSLKLEHTLAKRISCERYTPYDLSIKKWEINYTQKTIEGYLDSVPSLTFNTIKIH